MSKSQEKSELISWIASIDNETLIEELIHFKKSHSEETKDWWPELSEEDRIAIDQGLEDVKNGRLITHEEVKRRYESRFRNSLD